MTDDPRAWPDPAELLQAYGQRAKKRYSQNFLSDANILDEVADIAGARHGQAVLEIGPGPGGLTTRLLAHGAEVLAVEADPMMVEHLRAAFEGCESLTVLAGDVLATDLAELVGRPPRHVAANLPYAIATEILFRMYDLVEKPARMALMFQREVADRIVALPGERAFGMLGLCTMFHYHATLERIVKPGSFVPPPKVTSAIVGFRRRADDLCDEDAQARIIDVARHAFQHRRKMLRKSLRAMRPDAEERLLELGVRPTLRPEALSLDEWLRLAAFDPHQA